MQTTNQRLSVVSPVRSRERGGQGNAVAQGVCTNGTPLWKGLRTIFFHVFMTNAALADAGTYDSSRTMEDNLYNVVKLQHHTNTVKTHSDSDSAALIQPPASI